MHCRSILTVYLEDYGQPSHDDKDNNSQGVNTCRGIQSYSERLQELERMTIHHTDGSVQHIYAHTPFNDGRDVEKGRGIQGDSERL